MTTQGDGDTDRKRNDDDVLARFPHCDVPTPTNSLALALESCRCSYHPAHVAAAELIFDRSSVDSRPCRPSGRLLRPNDLGMRRKIAVEGHRSCSFRFLTELHIERPPPRHRRPRSRIMWPLSFSWSLRPQQTAAHSENTANLA
jgi:hypothetical protein